ncbi:efflux RND transporter permease subunit [Bisgaard Taxon 10/6]|uniref:Efflux RND transporter permease subunit n=1 Tax=Exercitatus varius TaxID=67857 RepID=A0ABT6EQM8_9PAST|nr:efflux RND transporter permease subunit [Exercitatus varius]MDG2938948.1 efflux RND transporter permease subunit [Exercitatus varius]MDG2945854.1 efflux RND transporter permease subunit [Exercitatus varius]
MNFKISSWAIRHPIPIIVLFLLLTALGIRAFQALPINADPDMRFPMVNITVMQTGASADELENTVTRRVEDAVAGMAGVRHITSTITEGSSVTAVEFRLETDTDRAVNDVRNAITQIRGNLPQNIDNPVVERMDTEGGALGYYAVQSPNMNQTELSWFIDDAVSRELLAVNGVQQVKRLGGKKREVRVALQSAKLNALGITAEQVSQQLAQTNANVPAGRVQWFDQEQSIRVVGSQPSLADLANLPIALSDYRKVKLAELATISDSHADVRSRTRLNGREVLGFQVFRSKGSSDTAVEKGVQQALQRLAANYPDIQITEVHNSVNTTKENYDVAISTLLEGAALTVLVVWLFLRNWRATLVAAIALPLSILPAFWIMKLLGYTLNSISLLAITLVIGILVDDAIVEIENIETHIHQGKRPFQAALDASDAIGLAVVAITASIVAVFLPVSFIDGMTGQYFGQFGITVAAAVLSSLLVARLATPLLAAYLLQPTAAKTSAITSSSKLKQGYLTLLAKALHFRKTTLLLGGVFLVASAMILPQLPTGFVPKGDTGMSQLDVTLPPSSTLAQTDEILQKIDRTIRQYDEVALVFTTAGSGEINKGEVLIRLKPHQVRSISQKEFEDKLRETLKQFADVRITFRNEMAARDVSILLTGNDPIKLQQTANELKQQIQGLSSVENVQINAPLMKPEVQVKLRADEAAKAGVSPQAVGNLLQIATLGSTDGNAARFNLPDRQIPIRVTLAEHERNQPEVIRQLRVASSNGGTVPLSTVADIQFGAGSASLERFDRERRIAVEADLALGQTIGTALSQINELPIMQNLPDGVRVPSSGDAEMMDEMFGQFGFAMAAGVVMVLLVLVLLFKDFLQPLTILTALPLSIGGAAVGLLAYGAALDMSSVIGILMLMGIVTKNSILLVDFVIEKRQQGMARHQALIQSGSERVRPILMTTIAMVAGMVPAVFASGAAAAFRAPMAVAVIFGLTASTLLSLVFVPVVYLLMDDFRNWLAPKLAKLTSVTAEERAKAE